MDTTKLNILDEWNRRATRAGWAQGQAAAFCAFWHITLGIPLVVCTVVVGALANNNSGGASVIATLSIIAAILAGLQTFLNLSERSQLHKRSGSAYSNVRRSIEELVAMPPESLHDLDATMKKIRETFDTLAETTPNVPGFIWRRAYKKYERGTYKSTVIQIRSNDVPKDS
ncbi:MAG: hypothetical protein A2061_05145 [Gallionellales bacterium GWA2_59_43]|nr:MAG: hypothetical protein A2061_05145 [Gallionellales bacterium GWA2_59_43]